MHWFFIALLTPILHAVANHIDKHLISRYFKDGGVGSLVIFSSLFALLALPIICFFIPFASLNIGYFKVFALVMNGLLGLSYVIFYLKALEDEEATIVAPFFQITPVFGFILGYYFLGETLVSHQVWASVAIILGALLLSFNFQQGVKVKKKLLFLMLTASFLYALNGVIFKLFALHAGFAPTLFWNMVGQVLLGLILFWGISSYKTQFLRVIKENSRSVLGLNFFNSLIILIGDMVAWYALLLAPVTLIFAVSGVQPLFVFLFGILLTIFFPAFGQESLERRSFVQKCAGVLIIVIGSFFLN